MTGQESSWPDFKVPAFLFNDVFSVARRLSFRRRRIAAGGCLMVLMKFTSVAVLAVLVTCASGVSSDAGRGLLGVDSCGSYGKCQGGYSCGTLKAKQCYPSSKPTEKCTEEDSCLEVLEECGPKAFCKFNEKCVKDVECYKAWEAFVAAEVKPEKEVLESDCFSCLPLEFEEECKKVDVEVCNKVEEQKCEKVPTKECWQAPELKCEKVAEEECNTVLKEKCDWIKEQVCEDKTELVCNDVPRQVCTEARKECIDRNPCEFKQIGDQLCTTEFNCEPTNKLFCERRINRCARPERLRRLIDANCDEPCPEDEGKCEEVEKCITLTERACGALDIFPTARNDCAAKNKAECPTFVKNICLDIPAGCTTVIDKVCNQVTKPVCKLVDKKVCNLVPVKECKIVWKEKCKTIYKERCETINVEQCRPILVQKCETKQVEKCTPPEGIKCGEATCELGQKCGTQCTIVEEEMEECKEVTIEACIPN